MTLRHIAIGLVAAAACGTPPAPREPHPVHATREPLILALALADEPALDEAPRQPGDVVLRATRNEGYGDYTIVRVQRRSGRTTVNVRQVVDPHDLNGPIAGASLALAPGTMDALHTQARQVFAGPNPSTSPCGEQPPRRPTWARSLMAPPAITGLWIRESVSCFDGGTWFIELVDDDGYRSVRRDYWDDRDPTAPIPALGAAIIATVGLVPWD